MGIWQLNVYDYIFKVLITAVMELRTVGLGYCGRYYPRVAKETSLDFNFFFFFFGIKCSGKVNL